MTSPRSGATAIRPIIGSSSTITGSLPLAGSSRVPVFASRSSTHSKLRAGTGSWSMAVWGVMVSAANPVEVPENARSWLSCSRTTLIASVSPRSEPSM